MAYLKRKMGFCEDCNDGIEKPIIAKKCQYHYKKNLSLKSQAKAKIKELGNGNTRFEEFAALDKWFRERVNEMTGNCQECGERINKNIFKYAKCGVAHIFPKSTFPSISTHKLNWMELGATCGCHSRAEDFEKAMKMKVWPEMLRRIKVLIAAMAQEEKRRIPDIILQEIEPK